jgi:Zn-dependent M32 family carboxypeptidase
MNSEMLQKQTISLMNTISDIGAATAVLNWDQETYMPHGASMMRAEQISTLSTLMHQLLTGEQAKDLVHHLKEEHLSNQYPLMRLFVEEGREITRGFG